MDNFKTWTSYWKREGSAGMDMWNAPTVQSRQPLTYRLMESMSLGGPRWLGSSWQRGIAESGSSQLSTLMIETPGDLVWDLPCVQQASCLEGGPYGPYTCTLIKNPMMVTEWDVAFLSWSDICHSHGWVQMGSYLFVCSFGYLVVVRTPCFHI